MSKKTNGEVETTEKTESKKPAKKKGFLKKTIALGLVVASVGAGVFFAKDKIAEVLHFDRDGESTSQTGENQNQIDDKKDDSFDISDGKNDDGADNTGDVQDEDYEKEVLNINFDKNLLILNYKTSESQLDRVNIYVNGEFVLKTDDRFLSMRNYITEPGDYKIEIEVDKHAGQKGARVGFDFEYSQEQFAENEMLFELRKAAHEINTSYNMAKTKILNLTKDHAYGLFYTGEENILTFVAFDRVENPDKTISTYLDDKVQIKNFTTEYDSIAYLAQRDGADDIKQFVNQGYTLSTVVQYSSELENINKNKNSTTVIYSLVKLQRGNEVKYATLCYQVTYSNKKERLVETSIYGNYLKSSTACEIDVIAPLTIIDGQEELENRIFARENSSLHLYAEEELER